jgi:hypothetical protein
MPFSNKIAIDKRVDDLAGRGKYKQLANSGFISLKELSCFITRKFDITLNHKAID